MSYDPGLGWGSPSLPKTGEGTRLGFLGGTHASPILSITLWPQLWMGSTLMEGMGKENKSIQGPEPKCPKGAKGIEGVKASGMEEMRPRVQTLTLQQSGRMTAGLGSSSVCP